MSEYMPYGDFNWVESYLNGLSELSPMSDKGRVYEYIVQRQRQREKSTTTTGIRFH